MVALLLAMSCGKDDEDMLKDDGQINNDSPLPEPVAEAKKTFEFLQTKGYRGTEMPGRIRGFGKEYIWRVKNKKSG